MEESPPMTRLHLGAMGFGYSDWAGVFYPPDNRPGDYLSYYSRHFDTVELDTTFHATPPVDRVRRWADVTPDHFRFCAKVPKTVTHEGPIDRRRREMDEFVETMRALGGKLAVLLIQLPPSFATDQFDALARFFPALPTDIRFAVEFRNSSWGQQRTLDLLREHRLAIVMAEYQTRPRRILLTTDFLYVRWIGEHERFKELNREQIDVTASLEWWRDELNRVITMGQLRDVWGFFNNDFSGYSVATCRRFMRMMGLPVPQVDPMDEGRLFA
jgi:uncharacterized protein YecE (DUF72 family)